MVKIFVYEIEDALRIRTGERGSKSNHMIMNLPFYTSSQTSFIINKRTNQIND